jgi:ComF family protein
MTSLAPRFADMARAAASALLDFALPRVCVSCQRGLSDCDTGLVCGHCWSRVRLLPSPQCERCGHPTGGHKCRWCELLPVFVRAVRSYCWMIEGPASAIVHALKYDGWPRIGDDIGARLARLSWPRDVAEERSMLVPVPLAASRLRERGFNQSERIARAVGAVWGLPVHEGVLVRGRATETQTRLTPGERLRNVAGAFHTTAERTRLRGAHVIIVDDVVTTGATLNACALALHQSGARIVSYVTFGRAPAVGDRC